VGTVIPLRAVLETEEVGGGACREAVGHLLRSVRDEGLTVGAGSTRGLGRLKLQEGIALLEFDLGSREGILALLRRRANCGANSRSVTIDELVGGEPSLIPRPRAKLGVTIAWEPDGPLMVKSGSEGLGVDALPLVEPRDGGLRLVVPGSSVKGVLRSHAERIVRTVLDRNLPDGSVPKHERHLTQVGVPLVTELFGDAPGKARGRKGALTVWDISASWLSPIAWEQVLAADTPEKAQRIADSNAPSKVDVTVHVAVDRWTGGAARGLLYSGFEPFGPAFSELRLEVDLDLLPASLRNPASALVLLLLDDLARGVIALGYATNRGMGALKISSVVVTGLGSPTNPDTFQVELPRGPDSVAEAPGPVLVAARQQPWFSELAEAWAEWLQAERSRNAMGEQSRA
jgi:CRISPR/Cas system CSM-associated protein Csm3 (group 7 of RAMP superfamily)